MNLLGYQITKAAPPTATPVPSPSRSRTLFQTVRESFTGAWQRNVEVESTENLLAFSAVYSCISLISDDISKLRIKLVAQDDDNIWNEIDGFSPYNAVLIKPNRFQTRIQFLSQWITSKLMYGNTYILKGDYDLRGIVTGLYILDPRLVTPLVADDGSVWYQLRRDYLTGVNKDITIPASEIIHDRAICLFHPLMGVSPIFACGITTTQGRKIQQNSAKFFENMSRPSGQLTAPGEISTSTAERLKREFEENFSGGNIGRMFVGGDGLKYEGFTIPPVEAQMIEQLEWTVQDVARCFHVPLHKIGAGQNVTFSNIAALNQDYYSQTLQVLIEAIELLLDEGLAVPAPMGTELDLEGLLRMDPLARAEVNQKNVTSGVWAPNEARLIDNLKPVTGGNIPFMQKQNVPISILYKTPVDVPPSLPAPAVPVPVPELAPPPTTDKAFDIFMEDVDEYVGLLRKGLIKS